MQNISIQLGGQVCTVTVGYGARTELPAFLNGGGRQVVVIADADVARLHLDSLREQLPAQPVVLTFDPGEAAKSLATAGRLYDQLAAGRVERTATIVTFGGGVAGDLGGFVAATWQRGVRYVQVPTTVEAAIDASIGGKTAINIAAGKNLVGAFHQPAGVIIDLDFLATLPQREWCAGLAESVKHGAAFDREFLDWQVAHADALLRRERAATHECIVRNVQIKGHVVSQDEREAGLRAVLNYGHTIGHALEHALGHELRHGECVALGMLAENQIAAARQWLPEEACAQVRLALERLGLPVRPPRRVSLEAVLSAVRQDKKVRSGSARFVLLRGIGRPEEAGDVSDAEVGDALRSIGAV